MTRYLHTTVFFSQETFTKNDLYKGSIGNKRAIMLTSKKFLSTVVLLFLFSFSLLTLSVLLMPVCATDSLDSTVFAHTYGGPREDETKSLIQTFDGGFAMAGYSLLVGADHRDFFLVKTDMDGLLEWNQTFEQEGDQYASCLVQTTDEGYAVVGYSMSFAQQGNADFLLLKTDSSGNQLWNQTYKGDANEYPHCLVKSSDGGYALAGLTLSSSMITPSVTHESVWFVKTDSEGNMLWNQTYNGGANEAAYSLIQTSEGGYALAGYTSSFGAGGLDFWLLKTDEHGIILWNQTYGGLKDDAALSLVECADGGYVVAGFTESFGAGDYDFWVVKTDENGNMNWNQTYGGTNADYARSIIQTGDTGYAVAGETQSFGAGESDFWVINVDSSGNMQENQTYGGPSEDVAFSVVQTVDGAYAIAGKTQSFGSGFSDIWLIKTQEQTIIPEFSSWLSLPLFIATVAVVVIFKKRAQSLSAT